MADWKDVMNARQEADVSRDEAEQYLTNLSPNAKDAHATLLAAEAICAELRALATVINYGQDNVARRGGMG